MIFDWYKAFNLTEFLALDLVSKSYEADLEDVGTEEFLVVKGNTNSVVFRDVFLPIGVNEENPAIREGDLFNYAAFLDEDTQDVYVGIEVLDP